MFLGSLCTLEYVPSAPKVRQFQPTYHRERGNRKLCYVNYITGDITTTNEAQYTMDFFSFSFFSGGGGGGGGGLVCFILFIFFK